MNDDLAYTSTATGDQVAYRVLPGPPGETICYVPGYLYSIESILDDPPYARFIAGLQRAATIVLIEKLGVGASDPLDPDRDHWVQWADGLIAVADAVGVDRMKLLGYGPSGDIAIFTGLAHPERIDAIAAFHPNLAISDEGLVAQRSMLDGVVGRDADTSDTAFDYVVPSRAHEAGFLDWNLRAGRLGAGPRAAATFWSTFKQESPLRDRGPELHARLTVIVNRAGMDRATGSGPIEAFVRTVPDAELRIVDGIDVIPNAGDVDGLAYEVLDALAGDASRVTPARQLRSLLFTDIVQSTTSARLQGDDLWTKLLDHHDRTIERIVRRHGGNMVKTTGDGALMSFDSPSPAIDCALRLRARLAELDLTVRMGLHAGEVETRGHDVGGIAVHFASRVMSEAGAGTILASAVIPLAALGSGWRFERAGWRELRGFDGEHELFELVGPA